MNATTPPGALEGYRRWRRLPARRRRQLAGWRPDGPRDRAEAEALIGFGAHLRGWTGVIEWAVGGAAGVGLAAMGIGLLQGDTLGVGQALTFVAAWTVAGALVRPLRGTGHLEQGRAGLPES